MALCCCLKKNHYDPLEADLLADGSLQVGVGDDDLSPDSLSKKEEILPYSCWNEVSFFFRTGIPLGLMAVFDFGLPPLMVMYFAGQTENSVDLQAALGYARTFYSVTMFMPIIAMCNYIWTVVPGCVGAGRKDRIANYFRRSMLMITIISIPFMVMQFFADKILTAVGVPAHIGADVVIYTRIMAIASLLLALDMHFNSIFVNMGYPRSAALNSVLTGAGIDIVCGYIFIARLNMGILGAALTQLTVKIVRGIIWLTLVFCHGIWDPVICSATKEPIVSWTEIKEFIKLALPSFLNYACTWVIFELQSICLANVKGIDEPALAAGALWLTWEAAMAAVSQGWLHTTQMRSLQLLGMKDAKGAKSSYTIMVFLTFLVLALFSVGLMAARLPLSHVVSNDYEVQDYFASILWILVLQTQTRVCSVNSCALHIATGKGALQLICTFIAFDVIAAPVSGVLALSDVAFDTIYPKVAFSLGATSMAQGVLMVFGFTYVFGFMNWKKAAVKVNGRANSDSASLEYPSSDEPDEEVRKHRVKV